MNRRLLSITLASAFLLSLLGVVLITINIEAQEGTFVEDVSRRTRTGKVFNHTLDSSRFATNLSIGAVHYDGPAWKDIDNTLVPSTADVPQLGLADWEMTQDDYEWYALTTLNTVPMWLFRNRSVPASYITFNPQALQWTNDLDQISQVATIVGGTIGQVSGNSLHWEDAYGAGRNLTLFTSPNRMVKHLTLDAYPGDPPAFITDGANASLELRFIFDTPSGPDQPDILVNGVLWDRKARVQTADEVEFRLGGETLFVFAHPVYFDSNESDDAESSGVGTMVLTRQGGNVIVGVRVPLAFLQNATYPVTIDPTLDLQVGASSDDAYQKTSGDVVLTGSLGIVDNVDEWNGYRWTSVTVPNSATIDVAHMEVEITNAGWDEPNHTFFGNDVDSAVTFSATTNNVSGRARTSASEVWDNSNLGAPGRFNTTDLSPLVNEIVNRTGWGSGNDLVIVFRGDGGARDLAVQSWDQDNANAATLHIEYTAGAATCEALTVVVNNPASQMFFNGTTDDPVGGLWQEENISEDFQTAVTPAMNVTNDDGVGACNLTLELLTSPGSGRTMKFSTTSTPPNPGVNSVPVGSNVTVANVASGATQEVWLWIDLDDSQGGQATPDLRVDTEIP